MWVLANLVCQPTTFPRLPIGTRSPGIASVALTPRLSGLRAPSSISLVSNLRLASGEDSPRLASVEDSPALPSVEDRPAGVF